MLCHIGVGLALTLGCCGLHARGVYAAIAFSDVIVRSFEGRIFLPTLHFPRTDAAECDTHFYVLSALGNIFHMTTSVVGVIDTVLYRVVVD